MKLTEEQYQVVVEETLARYPEEAVIAIAKDGRAVPLKNLHPQPLEQFEVSAYEVMVELEAQYLIHSHPYILGKPRPEFAGHYVDVRIPSKMDMQCQIDLDIPFGIVSCDGENVSQVLWFPDFDSPILGQEYIANAYDCYRIVRAYYWQNYGIKLDDHPRDYQWWKTDPDMYRTMFKDFGWYEIKESELEPGDLIFIQLAGMHESHSGIYIGNNQFIHHMNNQLSCVENYSKWRDRMCRYLRHKDKPKQ